MSLAIRLSIFKLHFSTIENNLFDIENITSGKYIGVIIDLSELKFISPSGLCYLTALVENLVIYFEKNRVKVVKPENENLNNYLTRMNFFEILNIDNKNNICRNDCSKKLLELQKIDIKGNGSILVENLSKVLKNQLTVNNKDIYSAVTYTLGELIDNTESHSESLVGGIVCAQTYLQKNILEICIIDSGIGIKESLRKENNIHKNKIKNFKYDSEFIEYAIGKEVTSKTQIKSGHSGEGLFFTSEFIKENKGRMKIISGNGILTLDNNKKVTLSQLSNHWQGTIIILEFDLENAIDIVKIFNKEIPLSAEEFDLDDIF